MSMERFVNIVHYFAYRADYRLRLWLIKFNPFVQVLRIPLIDRFYKRKGVDLMGSVNEAFGHREGGISVGRAGAFVTILVSIVLFALLAIFLGLNHMTVRLRFYHFLIIGLISFIVNYFAIFRKDKYLAYFREFEKMPKAEKRKWAWASAGTTMSVVLFLVVSLWLFPL